MVGGAATPDYESNHHLMEASMRSLILYLLGIPIPIIILIALLT